MPKKYPKCGSDSIAKILYGLPAYNEQMERDLEAGKIVETRKKGKYNEFERY